MGTKINMPLPPKKGLWLDSEKAPRIEVSRHIRVSLSVIQQLLKSFQMIDNTEQSSCLQTAPQHRSPQTPVHKG